MNCMKCGRETEPGEVFCTECLNSMAQAPVKPGTPVTIPKRPKRTPSPISKKQQQEEFEALLCRKIQRLRILCGILAAALFVSLGLLAWHFISDEHDVLNIGQNYSTESPGSPNP